MNIDRRKITLLNIIIGEFILIADPKVVLGEKPNSNFDVFLNYKQIQNYTSENCGRYCIACCHFIDNQMKHGSRSVYDAFSLFVNQFDNKHSKNNDATLRKYFEEII